MTLIQRPSFYHAYVAACHAELGQMEEARAHAAMALEAKPDFSVEVRGKWLPFKKKADLQRFLTVCARPVCRSDFATGPGQRHGGCQKRKRAPVALSSTGSALVLIRMDDRIRGTVVAAMPKLRIERPTAFEAGQATREALASLKMPIHVITGRSPTRGSRAVTELLRRGTGQAGLATETL